MILKFRSRLGCDVKHKVVAQASNWLVTTNIPRLEFWITKKHDVYLIAGTYRWSGRRKLWVNGELNYFFPMRYMGNCSIVQFDDYGESVVFQSLGTLTESPYKENEL